MTLSTADLSVLLIEPSSTQEKLITRALTAEGIANVSHAHSGAEALAQLSQYSVDLIITAMYLPDMSAEALIDTAREQHHDECFFMLISSETGEAALDPIRQAGVIAILPKPFDAQDLSRALQDTLLMLEPNEITLSSFDITEIQALVVDDSLTSSNQLCRILKSMGLSQIDRASNGIEAIALIDDNDYDIIFSDFNMPELDGGGLLRHIRQERLNGVLPVVMATSIQDKQQLDQLKQDGATSLLSKPYQLVNVQRILMELFN
jgi:two-component system chemotaxis response regulator CheY